METAKVDIKKLQILSDRINQCIDALNQVRISVHGLSHSTAAGVGTTVPGSGFIDHRVADPRLADPRFVYGIASAIPGYGNGLAHSTAPQIGGFPPVGIGAGNPAGGHIPMGIWNAAPYTLSHTALEADPAYNRPLWADPLLAARVAQTFPFVQFALPPVVPLY